MREFKNKHLAQEIEKTVHFLHVAGITVNATD